MTISHRKPLAEHDVALGIDNQHAMWSIRVGSQHIDFASGLAQILTQIEDRTGHAAIDVGWVERWRDLKNFHNLTPVLSISTVPASHLP
jgi:hypothetical protein